MSHHQEQIDALASVLAKQDLTALELANKTGVTQNAVREHLYELDLCGHAMAAGGGKWTLCTPPRPPTLDFEVTCLRVLLDLNECQGSSHATLRRRLPDIPHLLFDCAVRSLASKGRIVIGRDGIWPLKGRTEAPSPVERQVLDLIEENPGIPEFGVVSRFRLKRPEVRRCIGDLVWNGLVVDRDGYLHLRSESDGPPVITNLRFQGDRASRAALAAERSKNVAARMAGLIRGGRYPAKRLPRVRAKRRDDNSRIKIPAIQHLVAIEYSVSIEAMVGSRRSANVVLPRHIAMYLCNIVAGCSLSIIGMEFGDRDHTTVLHAVHKMEKKIKRSPALARKIKALSEQIGSGDAENVESCAASA